MSDFSLKHFYCTIVYHCQESAACFTLASSLPDKQILKGGISMGDNEGWNSNSASLHVCSLKTWPVLVTSGEEVRSLVSVFMIYMLPPFCSYDCGGIVSDASVLSLYSCANVSGFLAEMVSSGSEFWNPVTHDTKPVFSFVTLEVCTVVFS